VALDYDSETLNLKTYEELNAQPFDDDPVERLSILAAADAAKPLNERLELVQKMDNDAKHAFMTSLSLEEWEETGDWFLDRFSAVVNKMKDARKARRKLTKSFEEEIFKRHERVQRKKRDIEEALTEMSRSGQGVLRAGTPKRTRV
jgi:hypothetical protein